MDKPKRKNLELLKNMENSPIVMNPKEPHLKCAYKAGYTKDDVITYKRTIANLFSENPQLGQKLKY